MTAVPYGHLSTAQNHHSSPSSALVTDGYTAQKSPSPYENLYPCGLAFEEGKGNAGYEYEAFNEYGEPLS